MLIFPCLIACACFSSDYFLSCLGDETRLSARNIDEVNTKFDEMFERIKLLEDKNVQLEKENGALKERVEVLERGDVDGWKAAHPSSDEETIELRRTTETRGLKPLYIFNELDSTNLNIIKTDLNIKKSLK